MKILKEGHIHKTYKTKDYNKTKILSKFVNKHIWYIHEGGMNNKCQQNELSIREQVDTLALLNYPQLHLIPKLKLNMRKLILLESNKERRMLSIKPYGRKCSIFLKNTERQKKKKNYVGNHKINKQNPTIIQWTITPSMIYNVSFVYPTIQNARKYK